jgi:chemotaxis protein histidine kinase CheA
MVSPNKEHRLEIPEGCGYHLSVVSLPRGTNGKTTVYVSVDGKAYVLATLDSQQNILQVPTDLIFNYQQTVTFFSKGSATVHCVGYRQALDLDDDDDNAFAVQEDDSDAKHAAPRVKLPVDAIEESARPETASEDDAEEEEEEEEGSVDHEGMAALMEESEEDEEDDEEDEDEDEEADSDVAEEPARARVQHVDPTAPSDDDEEEEDEEIEDDEEGSGEEEEDEEASDDDETEEEESAEEVEEAVQPPPMKAARAETSPSKASPQRPSNGSPQRRQSGGSPQGRQSGGSPRGRRSA